MTVTAAATWADLRVRTMGTEAHLAVLGDDPTLLLLAQERLGDLEGRWSRFRPDSTLCRLNRSDGRPVVVDEATFDLVATAVGAWHGTGGRFDPSVLDAVVAAGYDRSFDRLPPVPPDGGPSAPPGGPPSPSPGCAGIRLDPDRSSIELPSGVHLDLGGIGKGRAADLVATELVAAGARAAFVNLGGDLRVVGPLEAGRGLQVAVEDPLDLERALTTVEVTDGALATSSVARRRWVTPTGVAHHLIDPATGAPSDSPVAAVTVLAPETTTAETLAKAALVAGPDGAAALLADAGHPALVVDRGGVRHRLNRFEEHER